MNRLISIVRTLGRLSVVLYFFISPVACENWFGGTEVGNPTGLTNTNPDTIAQGDDATISYQGSINPGDAEFGNTLDLDECLQNPGDFEEIWDNLFPGTEAPSVDFSSYDVLVVSLGYRPSSGYSLEIQDIITDTDSVTINVVEVQPGENCVVENIPTNPYHIVSVTKSNLPYTFELTQEVENCP